MSQPKIFGFKAISQGSHTLIAGHMETKDGNIEFSTAFDHSNARSLIEGLINLTNSISSITRIAECYHGDWQLIDSDRKTVRCYNCGLTTTCDHRRYVIEDASLPIEQQVRTCSVCQTVFKVDSNGKIAN